jgi:hypothetical protein
LRTPPITVNSLTHSLTVQPGRTHLPAPTQPTHPHTFTPIRLGATEQRKPGRLPCTALCPLLVQQALLFLQTQPDRQPRRCSEAPTSDTDLSSARGCSSHCPFNPRPPTISGQRARPVLSDDAPKTPATRSRCGLCPYPSRTYQTALHLPAHSSSADG